MSVADGYGVGKCAVSAFTAAQMASQRVSSACGSLGRCMATVGPFGCFCFGTPDFLRGMATSSFGFRLGVAPRLL